MTVRLGLLIPFGRCSPDLAFHVSFIDTLAYLQEQGIEIAICHQAGDSNISHAREWLMWRAYYAQPEITHFLYIDDDMGWTPAHIGSLLASDHDFCAATYPKKADKLELTFRATERPLKVHPRTGFVEAMHIGFGFTMLKRSVISKMMHAYPELHYVDGDGEFAQSMYGLFINMISHNDRGTPIRMGEDVAFCQRWRDIGGEIWVDPNASLVHAGRKEYRGSLRDVIGST